jgi:hypothetical protein
LTNYEKLVATAGFAFFSSLGATQLALTEVPATSKLIVSFYVAVIYAGMALFNEWCNELGTDGDGKGKVAAVCAVAGSATVAYALKPF